MALIDTKKRRKRRKKRRPVSVKPTPKPTPKPSPAPTPTPAPASPSPSAPAQPTQPAPTQPAPTQPAEPTPTQPTQPSQPTVEPGAPVPLVATPAMSATLKASARERLFLNRFGTGFSQRALAQLRSVGTPEEWLAAQLTPERFVEHPKVATVDGWFTSLRTDSPATRWTNQITSVKGGWEYNHELGNWSILRRVYSERTVLERMTGFWSDNLHVALHHDRAWVHRFDYDATIRRHALGRFEDLLVATALHPAMRLYLDNWKNVRDKPNENQGRELLELHTVGRGAGYTEAMVKDSAKILSGYTVDWGESFDGYYKTAAHYVGPVSVLGFSHANPAADGQSVTEAYLRYLARHPATATNLATKLARHLVSDAPSAGLVDTLAQAYLANGTSIGAMLTALATHPEFAGSSGLKVRTPIDDLVATARVLEVDVNAAPDTDGAWSNAANWTHGGEALFSWPRPDGPPSATTAWSSASRMFGSYSMHWAHAGGWYPRGAAYTPYAGWLPAASLRFDAYVEHLCQRWLGRSADARLQQVALQAAGVSGPSVTVNKDSAVARWMAPSLTASLLDNPDHMAP
ncbi:Protein of unknown function [Nocardioides scoriae]|uniref:DUF1800 domain-containing protein n=1 Tax=Nocardioides scoriae TaxID=642780 RepID=A0A1H1MAZ2_9ACTN|nr:DUF1800 family protein [Nocardioides scoriae]SDR83971.1 Protein of unknown function [Nocardioides scoriae]